MPPKTVKNGIQIDSDEHAVEYHVLVEDGREWI